MRDGVSSLSSSSSSLTTIINSLLHFATEDDEQHVDKIIACQTNEYVSHRYTKRVKYRTNPQTNERNHANWLPNKYMCESFLRSLLNRIFGIYRVLKRKRHTKRLYRPKHCAVSMFWKRHTHTKWDKKHEQNRVRVRPIYINILQTKPKNWINCRCFETINLKVLKG